MKRWTYWLSQMLLFIVCTVNTITNAQNSVSFPVLQPSYSKDFIKEDREFGIDCIQNVFHDSKGRLWLQTCDEAHNTSGIHLVQHDGYRFYPYFLRSYNQVEDYYLSATGINTSDQIFGTYINRKSGETGAFFLNPDTRQLSFYAVEYAGMSVERNALNFLPASDTSYLLLTSDRGLLLMHQFEDGQLKEIFTIRDPEILSKLRGWDHTLLNDYPTETWLMGISLPLIRYDKKSQQIRKYHLTDFDIPPDPDYINIARLSSFPSGMVTSSSGTRYLYFGYRFYRWDIKEDRFFAMSKEFPENWKAVGVFKDQSKNICFVFRDDSDRYQAILEDSAQTRYDYSAFVKDFPFGYLANVASYDFRKEVFVCGDGAFRHIAVNEPGAVHQLLDGEYISSTMELPDGRFLVNTVFDGWFEISKDLQQERPFEASLGCDPSPFSKIESMTQQIIPDSSGAYWWLNSKYLYRYDPYKRICQNFNVYKPERRFNPALFALLGKGKVAMTNWQNQLIFFDTQTGQEFVPGGAVPQTFSGSALDLHVGKDGTLWLLTDGGLWRIRIDQREASHIGTETGFDVANFMSIYEDEKGRLWLGTLFGGLYLYDPGKGEILKKINHDQGLSHNSVYSIMPDADGDIWVGTGVGITVLSPEGEIMGTIYKKDGLNSNSFFRFDPFRSRDGRLFFGSEEGLNVIDPMAVKTILRRGRMSRKIFLTELTYFDSNLGKEITLNSYPLQMGEIDLPAEKRNLRVKFAISSFLEVNKNHYAYRLAGYEEDWHDLGAQNELILTSLPPGRYQLQIKGCDFRNNWTKEILEIPIFGYEIFYKQAWFYLLCSLPFLLFGIAWAYRNQREKKMLELKVEQRTLKINQAKVLIEKQAQELSKLNQAKSRFFTNISHEFRTPLTVIIGMTRQLQQNPGKWLEKGPQVIQRNANNLLNLINQILELRRLESGSIQLYPVHGDVIAYLRYIHESLQSYAESRKVELVFYAVEPEIQMDYDEEKLLRILTNLLSNSIKFTPAGGKVFLKVSRGNKGAIPKNQKMEELNPNIDNKASQTKDFLILTVTDTGMGIPQNKISYIFDRFYQVEDESTRTGEGSGIGLALVNELVQLMQGEIKVESVPGEGSTFTIFFPIRHTAETLPELKTESHKTGPETLTAIYQDESEINTDELAAEPISDSGLPALLIVEDNADVVLYLRACLENQYQLSIAKDGPEGISKAIEQVPDLILSDVMMPKKNGFELCQTLKTDERTSHIPIVLLTAKADVDSRVHGWERGADAYLAKPFEQEELLVVLRKLLELRLKLQARYIGMHSPEPSEDPALQIEDAFVNKVRALITEHLDEADYKGPELCRDLGVSRTQLHNKIKVLSGKSISHFIRLIRLGKARELLAQNELQVAEIAYLVGFNDPSYFVRIFTKETGKTPGAYREENM